MNKSTSFWSGRKFSWCGILQTFNYSLESTGKKIERNIAKATCKTQKERERKSHTFCHPSQLTFALLKSCSHTVFPAPLGPTSTVRGSKKVMTCLSLSSIPKLLTPKMLILSIFDMFAFWKMEREREHITYVNQHLMMPKHFTVRSTEEEHTATLRREH